MGEVRNKNKSDGFYQGRERRSNFRGLKGKVVLICPEGAVTERSYFNLVENVFMKERRRQKIQGKVLLNLSYTKEDDQSNPIQLLEKMKEELTKRNEIEDDYDGLWIISDRDSGSNTQKQLEKLEVWIKENDKKRHWALSNRYIEDWFRLHFQKNNEYQAFEERYKKNNKKVKTNDFTYEQIRYACQKAREKKQKLRDLFTQRGSLMYEIVEFIGKEYQLCSEDSRGGVKWL